MKMTDGNQMLSKIKAFGVSAMKTLVPVGLNRIPCYGKSLSKVLEFGVAYKEELSSRSLKVFVEQLSCRVSKLEEKLESIDNGELAEQIQKFIKIAAEERNEEKIAFCAAIVSGLIINFENNKVTELYDEFIQTIINLSGFELILLKALYSRKPGEAVSLSNKGRNWLNQNIVIDDTTLAWIDVLVKKGLVEDASFETKNRSVIPTTSFVKSRTSFKLSKFARAMIDYMFSVQNTDGIDKT
jgi:hypothetical protein